MKGRQFILALLCMLALLLIPVSMGVHDIPEKVFYGHEKPNPLVHTYEPLLRQWADSIGWDWRLIASIVYHESRFNKNAQSSKGATGLMQINSSRYSEESLMDPSFNLRVGTRYLRKLEEMYPAATSLDTLKFTLAAYNLGEGKVGRLIQQTLADSLDATQWDTVALKLPKGHHTVDYVKKVLDSYASYRRLYPL